MATRAKHAMVVITRIPVPGQTKTRMMPALSPAQCADLHECLLRDVWGMCSEVNADVIVCYAAHQSSHSPASPVADEVSLGASVSAICETRSASEVPEQLVRVFGREATYVSQVGAGLGERLANATWQVFALGYERCVLLGVDAPELQPSEMREAFEALRTHQVVLGPSFDGGYYLIGMNQPHDQLFEVQGYGRENVLSDTLRIAHGLGLSCKLLRMMNDLDTADDLAGLVARVSEGNNLVAQHTAGWAARMLGEGGADAGSRRAG